MTSTLSRRRFITISAAATIASVVSATTLKANASSVHWQGIAMGARAELILNHPDRQKAEATLLMIQDEIRRLEKIFSIYDQSSSLSRLNRDGSLAVPPLDLIRCLDDAEKISRITDGVFDVTVQPLWNLYAGHFSKEPESTTGLGRDEIEAARKLVDYKAISNEAHRIRFMKPNMAITLNGIAQGYMTDRIAELLKTRGFDNVLINLGETRGLGHHKDGTAWRVGIMAPDESGSLVQEIDLNNQAVATSGGYGTRFTTNGDHHHLFDPRTGRSANIWASVSVIANDATRADALSTALFCFPESSMRRIARDLGVSVIAIDGAGTVSMALSD